jgi:hypothetical protein
MFESSCLTDLAFLRYRGYAITQVKARGNLVLFSVNINEAQAEDLLRSPGRHTCMAFTSAWREVDRVLAAEGRR